MRRATTGLLATLALAGCGGDDKTDEPAPSGSATTETQERGETLSATEWSGRVAELCGENRRRAEKAVRDLQREAQAEGLEEQEFAARVLDVSVETTEPLVDELAALPSPAGREAKAERFVELLQQTFPLFKRQARALRAKDAQALEENNDRILETAGESRRLARELDIEACIPRNSAR